MPSAAIVTAIKLLETLDEIDRMRVVDHLREYVADLQNDAKWDALIAQSQPQLEAMAQQAEQQIAVRRARKLPRPDEDEPQ